MTIETWKPVPGYEGFYEISDQGRVRRIAGGGHGTQPGRILNPKPDKYGYIRVRLSRNGHERDYAAHRLVLLAFVGEPPIGCTDTRHLDDNKTNNRLSNLAWGTRSENEQDKVIYGKANRGVRHGMSKLTPEQVWEIRRLATQGLTQLEIGERFGIHQMTVSRIVSRKEWRWLGEQP